MVWILSIFNLIGLATSMVDIRKSLQGTFLVVCLIFVFSGHTFAGSEDMPMQPKHTTPSPTPTPTTPIETVIPITNPIINVSSPVIAAIIGAIATIIAAYFGYRSAKR